MSFVGGYIGKRSSPGNTMDKCLVVRGIGEVIRAHGMQQGQTRLLFAQVIPQAKKIVVNQPVNWLK